MAIPLLDVFLLASTGGVWYFGSPIDILTFTLLTIHKNKSTIQPFITPYLPATILTLLSLLAALFISRNLLALSSKSSSPVDGPFKPLLFPCRTTHTRLFPKRHSFSYSYLLTGIPIGWSGSIGCLLSADLDVPNRPWYMRLFSLEVGSAWYTVHADDYLSRDHVVGGLRGKLDHYLTSQGETPKEYPTAYLLTAARFLGYSSNPVSIWNLYSSTGALSAVILEVNNTFDERHIYFLKSSASPPISTSPDQEGTPTASRFTHKWPKDFYVSPFNSRSGSYSLSAVDPFSPAHDPNLLIDSTITLTSSQNHPKLIARVFSTSPPLDPAASLPALWKLDLLRRWWWVGLATFPRTVRQAFTLLAQKSLPAIPLPEPGRDTISRHANPTEVLIESLFRRYLQRGVETSDQALTVRYSSSGVDDVGEVVMSSAAAQITPVDDKEVVVIKILSPSFYSTFVLHVDISHALQAGFKNATIECSHPALLSSVFLNDQEEVSYPANQQDLTERVSWFILTHLRPSPPHNLGSSIHNKTESENTTNPSISKASPQTSDYCSAFETFIRTDCDDERERKAYVRGVIKMLVASRVAFGWVAILEMQIFVVRVLCVYCVVWCISVF